MDPNLDARISTFYRRWHLLEQSKGKAGGLVLDFDMVRPQDVPAYGDRLAALAELDQLRSAVAATSGLPNPAYLAQKLAGSAAYLRALLGERRPFSAYLSATMGIEPQRISDSVLQARAAELAKDFADRGVVWGPAGREAYGHTFGRPTMDGFNDELRSTAVLLIQQLQGIHEGIPDPSYRIEVVQADAYWSNWIDGSLADGVTLKVNTHPRIEYRTTSALSLAAHEIAGHAVHVGCLHQSAAPEVGRVSPCALNLTVHACDAFQMEGLAQTMLHHLDCETALPDGNLSDDHRLMERYREHSGDCMGNAQLLMEDGASIDEVWALARRWLPLNAEMSLSSGLRDRSRDPLLRSYIHVYAPSRRLFMQAIALPAPERRSFFELALRELWTPAQLQALVQGRPADEVRGLSAGPPTV